MTEFFYYVELHRDTPTPCGGVTSLKETPGMQRLDEEQNPKFYTAALYDLHYLTVKCLSRVVIGAQSTTALKDYKNTKPGGNYAATIATHNMAWRKLCAVYGHNMPQTDMDRIGDVLKLVELYQGHNKTKNKYLQRLDSTGFRHYCSL